MPASSMNNNNRQQSRYPGHQQKQQQQQQQRRIGYYMMQFMDFFLIFHITATLNLTRLRERDTASQGDASINVPNYFFS